MKKKQEEFSKGTEIVLRKMFDFVNIKNQYDDFDFLDAKWFMTNSWNTCVEQAFIDWLAKEVQTNKVVRAALSNISFKPNKTMANKIASAFVYNYGWSTRLDY